MITRLVNVYSFLVFGQRRDNESDNIALKMFAKTTNYCSSSMVPLNVISDVVVLIFVVAVALHGRQVEWMARLDFLWQLQVLNRVFTITDMDKII
jgi:hypothetical protein